MINRSETTIILNSNNLVPADTSNSIYKYTFPQGSVPCFKKSKIAVESISMYYSVKNITALNNNNVFQYVFYTNGTSTTYTITIPDRFLDIAGINAYLQDQMVANGTYLVNAAGDYVYYLELVVNVSAYSIQVNSYPFPTALPVGWTNPSGITFPATASCPLLIVPATSFQDVIGFTSGIYPLITQTTTYSVLSTYTPQVSPLQSFIITCSLLNNKYSMPKTIFYSFSPAGTSFGNEIRVDPNAFNFINIRGGTCTDFDIQFFDQNLQRIQITDTNLTIQLIISDPEE